MNLLTILKTLSIVSIVSGFVTGGKTNAATRGIRKSLISEVSLAAESETRAAVASVEPASAPESEEAGVVELLDDALRSNTTAAADILSQISKLREQGDQSKVEGFVSDLLEQIDGGKLPLWSRFRPLTRFSKRARKASLRRVLDLSTPLADQNESEDDEDAARRRRTRSFVILLRTLAQNGEEQDNSAIKAKKKRGGIAVVQIEKVAKKEARSNGKGEDLETRLPPGLETPKYQVLIKRPAGYEIRKYEAFSVCSVSMNKPRPDASRTDAKIQNPQLGGASAFGALAGYLFGKNEDSTAMKMTTPVISSGSDEDRRMSFVLPSTYWKDVDQAPSPLSGSGVQLETDNGGTRATVMFGGFANKKDVEQRTQQLLEGLSKDKEYQSDPGASVTLAQYNDPFTPPWKRRNEVSIKVVPREK